MNIKKLTIIFILVITGLTGLFACELEYKLTDSNGIQNNVSPDRVINLNKSETYTLEVTYFQDHGRCDVEYDDTDFILEDEKWKSTKDYLPLQLLENITWEQTGSRTYITKISFIAKESQKTSLEIIRDCDRKSGYDEFLKFNIK